MAAILHRDTAQCVLTAVWTCIRCLWPYLPTTALHSLAPHKMQRQMLCIPMVLGCLLHALKDPCQRPTDLPPQDFYDYKVQGSEGFSKQRLFEIMDGLEARSIS